MRPSGTVVVVPFRDDLAQYFAALNREWIEHYFVLEEADLTVFKDPRGTIVEPGSNRHCGFMRNMVLSMYLSAMLTNTLASIYKWNLILVIRQFHSMRRFPKA